MKAEPRKIILKNSAIGSEKNMLPKPRPYPVVANSPPQIRSPSRVRYPTADSLRRLLSRSNRNTTNAQRNRNISGSIMRRLYSGSWNSISLYLAINVTRFSRVALIKLLSGAG